MNEIAGGKEREQLTIPDVVAGAVNTVQDRIEAALEQRAQQEIATTEKVVQASMDRAARGVIEHNYEELLSVPQDNLKEDVAHETVKEDIASFRAIDNKTERYFAAVDMGENAQSQAAYKAELQKQASDIAAEVDAAYAENNHRIAAKEDRKRAEWESMADAPQVEAERAIGARSHDAKSEGRTIESMEPEAARRMAVEDLEDLRKIKMPERLDDAAVVIQDNMRNPAYKAEFERLDAEAAISVEILAAQAGERVAL